MLFKAFATATALIAAVEAVPNLQKRGLLFNYNSDKIYGVNLGGWFVLEPWITPSIFEAVNDDSVVDEYTLSQKLGSSTHSTLQNHWNTWITQDDFNQIAQAGLNHVRVPVGYWAVSLYSGDPYVQGQLDVLDKAVGWARSAKLKMLIDLHGVPCSQNGFDNSGHLGPVEWQSADPGAAHTLSVIDSLAKRYASHSDVVTSIEVANEPQGSALDMTLLKKYYYDAWGTIRKSNYDTVVVIHDAFEDMNSYWNGFMNHAASVWDVMLDTHKYQIFSNSDLAMSPSAHVSTACALGPQLATTDKWTVVGEWTGAMTDCAQWLNGKGKGAKYDGTIPGSPKVGSCDGKYKGTIGAFSASDKINIRRFIEAQLDAYEKHTGWIFWTWKAESAPEWHMQDLIAGGLFPQPLSARKYPGQCS